jgi:hypothetical protein
MRDEEVRGEGSEMSAREEGGEVRREGWIVSGE